MKKFFCGQKKLLLDFFQMAKMKKMKVLVVGGGGREHALAWKIKQSPRVEKIFIAPGNGGTALIGENILLEAEDLRGLLRFALKEKN